MSFHLESWSLTPLGRALSAIALTLALSPLALAIEPTGSSENLCIEPEVQRQCNGPADCAGNERATLCVEHEAGNPASRRCENPCEAGSGIAVTSAASLCAMGETCVEGRAAPSRRAYWCKPTSFRVDLNLLDQCVTYHLGGLQPSFNDNFCSLDANLTSLLDQNGDRTFNIFDLDLCILAFLEQPGCDPTSRVCEDPALVACSTDDECGDGLYCNLERNACERDCGIVASREEGETELDRKCMGQGKVCDYSRGRCVRVDVTQSTCEVDSQCPAGAYCFLGRCAPNCFRSAECPSSDWYCTENNRCRALPPPEAEGGFVFDPQNYAIRFVRDQMKLDPVQTSDRSALIILDLLSKKQVINNPSVSFGYRLELTYSLKLDAQCLKPFIDCADNTLRSPNETEAQCRARQDDCFIDDTENWVTLETPFGVVSAQTSSAIGIRLDEAVAANLSPGTYHATLRAIFDNGDSHSIKVQFTKASPSGEYDGRLTVYRENINNSINSTAFNFGMRLKVNDTYKRWNELLREYGIVSPTTVADDNGFVDITQGLVVHGELHGAESIPFTKGDARTTADNEIPFVGLYSPDLRRMRLIGLIDVPGVFCVASDGKECQDPNRTDGVIEVRSPFTRDIRRVIEFIGPFDDATGRFHGIYREKISNLVSHDLTLEGGFILDQVLADNSPLPLTAADFSVENPYNIYNVARAEIENEIVAECGTSLLSVYDMTSGLRASDVSGAVFGFQTYLAAKFVPVTAFDADDVADWADGAEDEVEPEVLNYVRTRLTRIAATLPFRDSSTFERYVENAERSGPSTSASPTGRTTVLPALREFKDTIFQALQGLGTDTPQGQQNYLSVYDFLSPYILPCQEASASPPPVCIDETSVRCGLALHRKAIFEGWVPGGNSVIGNGYPLFCPDTMPLAGCPVSGEDAVRPFAIQEHNRFWSDRMQIAKFDADKARSDAFLVLFRNEYNPFLSGAAIDYKLQKLQESLSRYDEMLTEIVGPAGSWTLLTLDLVDFSGRGREWLDTMHIILSDRMDALAELIDLKRRLSPTAENPDSIYADHLMQHEYLSQVFLMELQAEWEGPNFQYRGEASRSFTTGQTLLNQLHPAKNAVGVTPGQVYFENARTDLYNWQHYRSEVGAFVDEVKDVVDSAVTNLKSSMTDLDTFERSLHESQKELTQSLNAMCGDPDPGDPTGETDDYCQYLLKQFQDQDEFRKVLGCKLKAYIETLNTPQDDPAVSDFFGFFERDFDRVNALANIKEYLGQDFEEPEDCPEEDFAFDTQLVCLGRDLKAEFQTGTKFDKTTGANQCAEVVVRMVKVTDAIGGVTETEDLINKQPTCDLSTEEAWLDVNGVDRPCVGGQMGALLQAKADIDRQRIIIVHSFAKLLDDIDQAYLKQGTAEVVDYNLYWRNQVADAGKQAVSIVQALLEEESKTADNTLEAVKCILIAGVASGTDCFTKATATVAQTTKDKILAVIKALLSQMEYVLDTVKNDMEYQTNRDMSRLETFFEMPDPEELIGQYNQLTQTSFSLSTQIEDLRFQAQEAVRLYNSDITFVAEHLVGRETGNYLLGQVQVREADRRFRDLVQYLYRMAMAFIHHYNLPPAESAPLIAQAQTVSTLSDVEAFLETIDDKAKGYCGRYGLDCDALDVDTETLRISLRENLFPNLRDIVDPHTGEVLTAGQQFHNLITRPPFLKRRIRGNMPTDQIEIPFSTYLQPLENTPDGTPRWLIDPLSCNHFIDGRDPTDPTAIGMPDASASMSGSIAVNFLGTNVDDPAKIIRYQLVRGATDFLRGCEAENQAGGIGQLPTLTYPVRKHTVGYAPQSQLASLATPPSFFTISPSFTACVNAGEALGSLDGGYCWRYFARDRSLSAPDWKLIVPLKVDGASTDSAWIAEEGLAADEAPVIEDVVLYFRYRSRPIQE
jgi:hypothetical protein